MSKTPGKTLKVAVIGPKGQCGACVVDELLSRGHAVVGISRSPPQSWPRPGNYSSVALNIYNTKALAEALSQNFDAIVCAFGPPLVDLKTVYAETCEAQAKIKQALLLSTHKGPFVIIGKCERHHYAEVHGRGSSRHCIKARLTTFFLHRRRRFSPQQGWQRLRRPA